ncbi:hypothetical protein GBB10_11220 [Bifidobacterium longum]|uniref:Transmembrane protein n=1 Tax=Bacteroides fragilis TaxID=817 RepID=A0A642KS18_BACFG|nr:hypothetical protein F2Z45_19130 [Bacteroides fragilis]KAB7430324.1 hypothetical protein GBB10_11220 [Bifidobacterium longum]KAA5092279.1 hypothetical protein F2Z40_00090 [Bacteroides fragilis]KAA5095807.1 hypothetical protein F2Z82_00935 [Bacteroides fragilis]KAA5103725.1 hypothetical protein F2Z46_05810 [Bacteroides fragilis]
MAKIYFILISRTNILYNLDLYLYIHIMTLLCFIKMICEYIYKQWFLRFRNFF